MKILTFNCWGTYGPPERQPVLAKAIRDANADILCLQEVPDAKFLKSFGYPVWLHAPDTSLGILSRFPAMSHRVLLYKTHSPLEENPRGLLIAELAVGTKRLWAGTTHLSWKQGDEKSRAGQAQELMSIMEPFKKHVLIGGDFNACENQAPIHSICEQGFIDLFHHLHQRDLGITWDNQNPFIQSHSTKFPDRRIDFLFLHAETLHWLPPSSCVVACRTRENGMYPSDHFGVMAEFNCV